MEEEMKLDELPPLQAATLDELASKFSEVGLL